jgi:hypothetical protein
MWCCFASLSRLGPYLISVVIDLEWPKAKISCILYGNKSCWVFVCELIPDHHDNEIAAAEDKTDMREA